MRAGDEGDGTLQQAIRRYCRLLRVVVPCLEVEGEGPLEAREMGDDAVAAVGDEIRRAQGGRCAAAEQGEEDCGEPWCCHFGTRRAQLVEHSALVYILTSVLCTVVRLSRPSYFLSCWRVCLSTCIRILVCSSSLLLTSSLFLVLLP
jgi:hypothetical protein